MAKVDRFALVSFSAQQMYDLVNDVASYPEFLPGCSESRLLDTSDSHMKASLRVAKGGISKWFTTHNNLTSNESIHMELVDGPFSHLKGLWEFTELAEDACRVSLKLDFEFSSGLLGAAFNKVFHQLASNMVQAFVERAKDVYSAK
ncbi:type II toxin-antitoxin system RatA family toxin [Echinimonas agarilytica]|uniref:Type II toxin-antitoxin system RatA family toxin n=1 Tax=Echinimonas agarilytica TaxID=1215918 RepID=A0AA41W6B4_9GAMM|nr:type II toxin-antitoxin system RatA family toxin [Echinimonas agarilytica]